MQIVESPAESSSVKGSKALIEDFPNAAISYKKILKAFVEMQD